MRIYEVRFIDIEGKEHTTLYRGTNAKVVRKTFSEYVNIKKVISVKWVD